ncbi:MAG: hypothetical protein J6J97_01290 [Akkermansia sp.]|nr:hypothetical protein [Akkermansia sp.]MBQ8376756.1 hypothetical protein [Akkermansia sp.]
MKQQPKKSDRHTFTFKGGEDLTSMGATWFISYLYHIEIDRNHRNWERLKTHHNRISAFKRTQKQSTEDGVAMHLHYIKQICLMSPKRLATNRIGLSGISVIKMAKELLPLMAQPK